jgi:hypothetical protein
MRFLQDQRTWPEWEPQQMRDPDWVEYAGQIRGDVAYITPTAFGCYVGLSTSRIITHVVEKKIPAVRTLGGRWKIQVNEIKTFEHHNEKQGRGPKKRYTDDEKQFIHDGARAGRSYREIGADLHRSERAINRMILLEKRQAKEVA